MNGKTDYITEECRRLHNEELNDLCSSPNIIRSNQEKLDGLGIWQAREIEEMYTGFWLGDLTRREHFGDADKRIILKCTFFKRVGETWTGLLWFRIGTRGGCL